MSESKDPRRALMTRVPASTYDTLRQAAAALHLTTNDFVALACVEKVARDGGAIQASNDRHNEEIERLSQAANDLIALSAGYDHTRKAA